MLHHTTHARGASPYGDGAPAAGDIRTAGLFLPGVDPFATDRLLDHLWRRRQASLLAGAMTLRAAVPDLAHRTGFTAAIEAFRDAPSGQRRALLEHPCLRIWLGRMTRLPRLDSLAPGPDNPLPALLADGARLLSQAVPATYVVQRYDVDPLLAAAVPPSYCFDNLDAKRRRDETNPYSLAFAREVIAAALQRVAEAWPAAREDFDRYVKIVVHLPDVESRSCSAARFAGAILLSADDETLLAVAESLVHECGHQILYCVMEADPLIVETAPRSFTLPWSGAQRDAYGYFHATYIYLILALFFEKVLDRHAGDREQALGRLAAIAAGLDRALADFAEADFFTETGRSFFENLADHAGRLLARCHQRFGGLQPENAHGPH
jgi:hypothetical protein